MPLQRTKSEFFSFDSDSSDSGDLAALVQDLDEEFFVVVDSLVAKEEEEKEGEDEEEEEEFYDAEEGVTLDQLFEEEEEEEEEDKKEEDKKEEEDKEDDEEWFDSEEGEFGSSLLPDDVSVCSEMSIDMEEYGGIDGSAVAGGEVQVGGNSACGWYPLIKEDIMMEEEDVEMVDADEGEDVVMEEAVVEEEDIEMEEVDDWMDVDGEFW
ncbi:hypothetical protein V8B55DRAFT_1445584 [Mucor lusitanicus]